MTDITSVSPQDVAQVSRLQQSYQRNLPIMMALSTEEFTTINIDVPTAYTLGTGTLIKVRPYREALLALPGIDRTLVENCEDYLLALGHAQALYLAATAPVAALPELYAQLLKQRELLHADATALSVRGLVPADKLRELKGPISHAATAFDVLALCSILRANWANIQGKSGVQLTEIETAELLADRLLVAVGERAVSDEVMSTTVRARQAAFTLFVRAYDEVRRGIVYLRWNIGDADEIAPSLYANRVKRRKGEDKAEDPKGDGTPASTTPAAGTAKPTLAAGAPNPKAPVGHPDSSPFLDNA